MPALIVRQLAVQHNVTPVGYLMDRLCGSSRYSVATQSAHVLLLRFTWFTQGAHQVCKRSNICTIYDSVLLYHASDAEVPIVLPHGMRCC